MKSSVCYYTHKIAFTSRSVLMNQLKEVNMPKKDREFLTDIIDGLSYKDFMEKYKISKSRFYQIRERIFEYLRQWEIANEKK